MATSIAGRRAIRALASVAVLSGSVYAVDQTNANILSRSARVMQTGAETVLDYRKNLKGTPRESPEYRPKLEELNMRIAQRILSLCLANGGIYTKFGQQIATMNHGLPRQITDTMAALQDRARPVSFAEAVKTIESDLKKPWQELFREFDETPIAAASLAQVHRAVDMQGRTVAVKVQYPQLAMQMGADIRVMKWAAQLTEYFFPDVQVQWLFPEFEAALKSELDFENEKRNSRRIATLLARNENVYVPVVYDELSSARVVTMEFISAPKISQVDEIEKLGLAPSHVARILCEVFSEMVFIHGFVHCDPHPGNIFVRKNPDPHAKHKEQLVLLDHGLYRELEEDFRKTYCDLWRAMLLRDTKLLDDCGKRLNVGEFAKYLPLLFTYRTITSSSPLAASMTGKEREELLADMKKLQFSNVTDFLEQLPRDMLFVFRTNNMIRALNKDLGGSTRDRFAVMGKYAVEGHSSFYANYNNLGDDEATSSSILGQLWGNYSYWLDHFTMLFHLNVVDIALGLWQRIYGDKPLKIKHNTG